MAIKQDYPISKRLMMSDATFHPVAVANSIMNEPKGNQIRVIKALAEEFYDKLMDIVPPELTPRIVKFFVSKQLKSRIGGYPTSDHMAMEDVVAIDLICYDNMALFKFIRDNMKFYRVIAEYPVNGKAAWVHVAYSAIPQKNDSRRSLISINRENSVGILTTIYLPFNTSGSIINRKEYEYEYSRDRKKSGGRGKSDGASY